MYYFCKVHLQSRKDEEKDIFVVLEQSDSTPNLTKEFLMKNGQYQDYCLKYKPKAIAAEYTVYAVETEIYANTQDDAFQSYIDREDAKKIAQGEITIDCMKDRSTKRKKKKNSPVMLMGIAGGILLVGVLAFGLGSKMGASNANTETNVQPAGNAAEDGMIVPEQVEIADDVQQITVSIDRSYSAVPTEDLQLKGAVVDGAAQITLPEFDKTDFFTHVSGYTWGFSTVPDGKQIEYYGGATYTFTADTKLYRVLVKYGGGSGTKEDPYLIDYYDQLELMAEEKARGYFRQIADITFPSWAAHKPIDTINELKDDPTAEYFEYDGNGFLITNLTAPLFGKVSGAVIKNVNIQSSFIDSIEYKNYGFIAAEVYNYQYTAEDGKTYETGETLIQHCTVSHSAIYAQYPKADTNQPATEVVTAPVVVPPDLVEYDENGNPITEPTEPIVIEPTKSAEYAIGAITGLGGQIENCYVTDFGIFAYLDDYFLYAGGISGKPASVTNSGVYYYSAQGKIFNAGGIAGSGSGAKMHDPTGKELPVYYGGSIQGCVARNIILSSEVAGGGIVGEGSTNAETAMITNCYANELNLTIGEYDEDGVLLKAGIAGGIIGCDGVESNGHYVSNTVSLANLSVIGKKTVSNFDETVRLAPDYAYYQQNILTVLNANSIHPDAPKAIFTGNFEFGDSTVFGDETGGSLAYPAEIADLFQKTIVEEE